MNARERRKERRNQIIAVCDELRTDSHDNQGLHPENYEPQDLKDCILNCTGFDYLSDPEYRLAVVAFEQGAALAKSSIWYK
jgi:hypothetical protein